MAIEVVTKDDLQEFRVQLLDEIKEALKAAVKPQPAKLWLRSKEVRKILSISPGTLQNLRIAGKIRSSKVGNLHYYRKEDIETLLNGRV